MRTVRDIKTVTVWSRTFANAQAFAERESARTGLKGTPSCCCAGSARSYKLQWLRVRLQKKL